MKAKYTIIGLAVMVAVCVAAYFAFPMQVESTNNKTASKKPTSNKDESLSSGDTSEKPESEAFYYKTEQEAYYESLD